MLDLLRLAPIFRRPMLAVCLVIAAGTAGAGPAETEDLPHLEQLVEAAARQVLPPLTERQRLAVGPLPPRLSLPRCDQPIQSGRAPGISVPGRVLVTLRCDGRSPWHLYVPAKVIGTTTVLLTAHALVAGAVLTPQDLATEQRDVVGLPPGYFGDPAAVIGLTTSRAIAGGAILTNQQLLGTQAVQRGQTVTLIADAGGIDVRMPGRALSDGFINQRVRVENLSSGKIVEGIARSAQVVEIVF